MLLVLIPATLLLICLIMAWASNHYSAALAQQPASTNPNEVSSKSVGEQPLPRRRR